MRRLSAREITYTAILAALVCVATLALQVGISASQGYFNIGEIMVYVSALLLGPALGAAAGGIGSSLADVLSGFSLFAPGTLVIKGIEAFLVAFVASHRPSHLTEHLYRGIATVSSVLIGVLLFGLGLVFYSGPQTSSVFTQGISLNITGISIIAPGPPPYFQGIITYGALIWLILGAAAAVTLLLLTLRLGTDGGWPAIAILVGGTEMVIGYLLYGILVVGPGAVVEVPANIGQMVIGLLVGLPVARRVRTAMPWLARSPL